MFVCPECFGQQGLKKRVRSLKRQLRTGKCSRHPDQEGVKLIAVSEIIDEVFRSNFELTNFLGQAQGSLIEVLDMLAQPQDHRLTEEIAQQLMNIERLFLDDVDFPFYGTDQYYESSDIGRYAHSVLWDKFCEHLIYERRFFNTNARAILKEIFSKIHLQRDLQGNRPIYMVTPGQEGSRFFRARIVDQITSQAVQASPSSELSAPPRRLRKAGRLNAAGIPVFYAAYDIDTCIAELRPPVGSMVMCGEFQLCEPICVLDTTRFSAPPKTLDIFDDDHMRRVSQWTFMEAFMEEVGKPILPSDEHLDYLPTQAVAEFLNSQFTCEVGNRNPTGIDALIFRSAQKKGGKNLALLGEAAHSPTDRTPGELPSWMDEQTDVRPRFIYKEGTLKTFRVEGSEFSTAEVSLWDENDPPF